MEEIEIYFKKDDSLMIKTIYINPNSVEIIGMYDDGEFEGMYSVSTNSGDEYMVNEKTAMKLVGILKEGK